MELRDIQSSKEYRTGTPNSIYCDRYANTLQVQVRIYIGGPAGYIS